jgi:hypothetical protein
MKRRPTLSRERLTGRFVVTDFAEVLLKLPEGCPVVGGQAVAWWAAQYGVSTAGKDQTTTLTSADIDFWGGRDDLEELARRLGFEVTFPHEYEMTVWVGGIPLSIQGERTLAEFLHTIPGLDTNDPDRASVEQEFTVPAGSRTLQFLSPVSLVLAKLHALRHFDQKERQDELHLRVCLNACQGFIAQLLRQQAIRAALWNCERLIEAHQRKPNTRLAARYDFNILAAVPVERIREASSDPALDPVARKRLVSFCNLRWPQALDS